MKTTNESDTMEVLLNIYLFCKKFIILLLVFLVLGVACGIYKYKSFKPVFSKQVLIYSEDISYLLLKQFTIALGDDISTGNYTAVSRLMFLDKTLAKKVTSAKTDSVALRGKVYALTTFTLTDTLGLFAFPQNYIHYLSSVPYLKNIIEGNQLKYRKILEKIDEKLNELDGLQDKINSKTASSGTTLLNDSYREYIDLYSKKMDYEEKLNNKNSIEILRESTSAIGPRFGLVIGCFIYGVIFFVIALIIGFIIELMGKLRKLEKSRK
ncbi:MAG: hypothetical protein WCQ95_09490 [Bacteroidota bacterium]